MKMPMPPKVAKEKASKEKAKAAKTRSPGTRMRAAAETRRAASGGRGEGRKMPAPRKGPMDVGPVYTASRMGKDKGMDPGKFVGEVGDNARKFAGEVGRNLDNALGSRRASQTVSSGMRNAPAARKALKGVLGK